MRVAILLLNAGRGSGEVARQHAAYLVSQGADVSFLHPHVGLSCLRRASCTREAHTGRAW